MKSTRVALFRLMMPTGELIFEETFDCREHAEQWVLNWSKKDKLYVILPLMIGRLAKA